MTSEVTRLDPAEQSEQFEQVEPDTTADKTTDSDAGATDQATTEDDRTADTEADAGPVTEADAEPVTEADAEPVTEADTDEGAADGATSDDDAAAETAAGVTDQATGDDAAAETAAGVTDQATGDDAADATTHASTVDGATLEPGPNPPAEPTGALLTTPAPAKRPRRSRAKASTLAEESPGQPDGPATATDSTPTADPQAVAGALSAPPEQPSRPARRSRRSSRAATVPEPVADTPTTAPAVAVLEAAREAAPDTADEAAPGDRTSATSAEPADPARSQAAAEPGQSEDYRPFFGVLFQAPADPTLTADRPALVRGESTESAEGGATVDGGDGGEESAPSSETGRRRRRRGGKGRRSRGDADQAGLDGEVPADAESREGEDRADAPVEPTAEAEPAAADREAPGEEAAGSGSSRRRTRRRRRSGASAAADGTDASQGSDSTGVTTKVREGRADSDAVTGLRGSTRLEAKKQRRREGREAGRRRTVITEAEFLARRESVERVMVVRHQDDRTQIGVLEDGVLVEHYVSRESNVSMAGNVYLGRIQNVLPSMEAAFVDIGKGRNAVLYAGEVNWDAAGLEGARAKRIENALSSGQSVLVQVTKDPMGHKGARLTSQISLPGRYLVYVPDGNVTGISRKLPENERNRLKKILREVVPDGAGVIVRTAAEGASEAELRADVERLTLAWEAIQAKAKTASAPALLHGEPDLTVRVIRDVFNEDFTRLVVAGEPAWSEVSDYLGAVAPDLAGRLERWTGEVDLFATYRVDEQLAKAMDRKVWLPSGGSLVIDRTEAMTVVDVNTGKFVGSGGNLEETVTRNNIEAAEEIVRQLRLRDIGGIIVIDFIDMVLESNRDLVVRRLLECLGRDRTKHQVAEVTSLGLVQMTRKRVGSGLIEVFSEPCEQCNGRGIIVHTHPVDRSNGDGGPAADPGRGARSRKGRQAPAPAPQPKRSGPTPAQIAAAAHAAAVQAATAEHLDGAGSDAVPPQDAEVVVELPDRPEPEELDLDLDLDLRRPVAGDEASDTRPVEPPPAAGPAAEQAGAPGVDRAAEQAGAPTAEHAAEPAGAPIAEHAVEPDAGTAGAPIAEPAAEPVAEPVAHGRAARRRRGRVVAPAGPPRAQHDGTPTSVGSLVPSGPTGAGADESAAGGAGPTGGDGSHEFAEANAEQVP
ncbi:MAG TPA: Rne/Rng family ribonuclease [Dermatophilaceae bacterium]|nr:Rne/Rng family ribonuclease [Dermatophilaceae bacterium]